MYFNAFTGGSHCENSQVSKNLPKEILAISAMVTWLDPIARIAKVREIVQNTF